MDTPTVSPVGKPIRETARVLEEKPSPQQRGFSLKRSTKAKLKP
jgi:hypothetical protein